MSFKAETGILSVILALSSSDAGAQDLPKTKENAPEYQFQIGEGDAKRFIPVDCDLLGRGGKLTSAFVKQLDIWGHLDAMEKRLPPNMDEDSKIFMFQQHLYAHGILPEKIKKAATHCTENFTLSR